MSNIRKDFQTGAQGEELTKTLFRKFSYNVVDPLDKTHDFRIIIPPELTVEVKHDLYSGRSGNVAIETFNTKQQKASGILASKTDIWCHLHYCTNELYISFCITKDLLDYIKTVSPFRIIDVGGDNNSQMMLYKQQVFMEKFLTAKYNDLINNIDTYTSDIKELINNACKANYMVGQ